VASFEQVGRHRANGPPRGTGGLSPARLARYSSARACVLRVAKLLRPMTGGAAMRKKPRHLTPAVLVSEAR